MVFVVWPIFTKKKRFHQGVVKAFFRGYSHEVP